MIEVSSKLEKELPENKLCLNGQTASCINDFYKSNNQNLFVELIKECLIQGYETYTKESFIGDDSKMALYNIKRGRLLSCSYEAAKFQRIDLFLVVIKQIGTMIARSCRNFTEHSNFIIDGDKLLNKEFNQCRFIVFGNE